MMKISEILRTVSLGSVAVSILLLCGSLVETQAQRDPFSKPSYQKPKSTTPSGPSGKGPVKPVGPAVPVNYGPPGIDARIEYYKRLRESAAAAGSPLPKVTSVLTLNELAVTGIFKTPRGYAAMVEATPIKLSYTIYPGEKFFDGQLVAIEENRLVFRKVTKTGEGKFVASVENKALRQYSTKAQIEGTAPSQSDKAAETTAAGPGAVKAKEPKAPVNPFLSPLDEMNNQKPAESDKGKNTQPAKKPVKVAKNDGH